MPHTDRYQSCLLERASTCERGGGYENGGVAPLSANFFPRRVRLTSRADRARDGVDGAECTRKVRRRGPVLVSHARQHRRQPAPRHLTHGELPGRSLSLEARGLGLSADPRARSAPRRRRARLPGVGTAALIRASRLPKFLLHNCRRNSDVMGIHQVSPCTTTVARTSPHPR